MRMKITLGKGVHLTMDNGVTLSIQIGGGNYCENRDHPIEFATNRGLPSSRTAEIAVWLSAGDMLELPNGDTVAGYVPVHRVFDAVPRLAALIAPTPESVIEAFGPDFFG